MLELITRDVLHPFSNNDSKLGCNKWTKREYFNGRGVRFADYTIGNKATTLWSPDTKTNNRLKKLSDHINPKSGLKISQFRTVLKMLSLETDFKLEASVASIYVVLT